MDLAVRNNKIVTPITLIYKTSLKHLLFLPIAVESFDLLMRFQEFNTLRDFG